MTRLKKTVILECHPEICGGQIVLHDSRIMVDIIFDQFIDDESDESIMENYPTISLTMLKQLRWIYNYCTGATRESSNA